MQFKVLVFLVSLTPVLLHASDECEELAGAVSSFGFKLNEKGGHSSIEKITGSVLRYPSGDCNIMHACSTSAAPQECDVGIRLVAGSAADNIQRGDAGWAHLTAALIRHTDGELTSELLVNLSYLLPEHPGLLFEVVVKHPHLERWIRTIVDPNPELREIEDRCIYFREILSNSTDDQEVKSKNEITRWADESYGLYQCDQQ